MAEREDERGLAPTSSRCVRRRAAASLTQASPLTHRPTTVLVAPRSPRSNLTGPAHRGAHNMTSPIVNVVRYSALISGIGYGVVHLRTLQKRENENALHAVKVHTEKLIEEKKRQEEQSILAAVRGGGTGVVSDPDSPQFDLEKLLQSLEK